MQSPRNNWLMRIGLLVVVMVAVYFVVFASRGGR